MAVGTTSTSRPLIFAIVRSAVVRGFSCVSAYINDQEKALYIVREDLSERHLERRRESRRVRNAGLV
jgi:hypothetical protein